jgi:hypothetical protein
VGAGNFFDSVWTVSGAQAPCPMGAGGFFPVGGAPEADHLPPSGAKVGECVGAVPPLPHTSSWHGA